MRNPDEIFPQALSRGKEITHAEFFYNRFPRRAVGIIVAFGYIGGWLAPQLGQKLTSLAMLAPHFTQNFVPAIGVPVAMVGDPGGGGMFGLYAIGVSGIEKNATIRRI